MLNNVPFQQALETMLELMQPVEAELIPLERADGRILASDVLAEADVPPFDRSPFDGYTFRSEDTLTATKQTPVTLRIIEEIPAGSYPKREIVPGTASKILTGGPIPRGANALVKYETIEFTDETVTLTEPCLRHDIVWAGEDVKKGDILARKGDYIGPALLGTLAAQGITTPMVFRRPVVGILSTGSELVEAHERISGGMIRNSNRYSLEAACRELGAETVNLGIAKDSTEAIAALMDEGLKRCDMLVSTGGVSVGDYDMTPQAMELAGFEIVVRKLDIKPGGACAYGSRDGKVIFSLSGNPAASLVNFYATCQPCLRKLSGRREYLSQTVKVELGNDFDKASPKLRLMRGRLDITDGKAKIDVDSQGNAALYSMNGCDLLAIVPAGSPELKAGQILDAYYIK